MTPRGGTPATATPASTTFKPPPPPEFEVRVRGPQGIYEATIPIWIPLSIMASTAARLAGLSESASKAIAAAVVGHGNNVAEALWEEQKKAGGARSKAGGVDVAWQIAMASRAASIASARAGGSSQANWAVEQAVREGGRLLVPSLMSKEVICLGDKLGDASESRDDKESAPRRMAANRSPPLYGSSDNWDSGSQMTSKSSNGLRLPWRRRRHKKNKANTKVNINGNTTKKQVNTRKRVGWAERIEVQANPNEWGQVGPKNVEPKHQHQHQNRDLHLPEHFKGQNSLRPHHAPHATSPKPKLGEEKQEVQQAEDRYLPIHLTEQRLEGQNHRHRISPESNDDHTCASFSTQRSALTRGSATSRESATRSFTTRGSATTQGTAVTRGSAKTQRSAVSIDTQTAVNRNKGKCACNLLGPVQRDSSASSKSQKSATSRGSSRSCGTATTRGTVTTRGTATTAVIEEHDGHYPCDLPNPLQKVVQDAQELRSIIREGPGSAFTNQNLIPQWEEDLRSLSSRYSHATSRRSSDSACYSTIDPLVDMFAPLPRMHESRFDGSLARQSTCTEEAWSYESDSSSQSSVTRISIKREAVARKSLAEMAKAVDCAKKDDRSSPRTMLPNIKRVLNKRNRPTNSPTNSTNDVSNDSGPERYHVTTDNSNYVTIDKYRYGKGSQVGRNRSIISDWSTFGPSVATDNSGGDWASQISTGYSKQELKAVLTRSVEKSGWCGAAAPWHYKNPDFLEDSDSSALDLSVFQSQPVGGTLQSESIAGTIMTDPYYTTGREPPKEEGILNLVKDYVKEEEMHLKTSKTEPAHKKSAFGKMRGAVRGRLSRAPKKKDMHTI